MYKISIILPCYNVENYITKCLDSITNQSIGIEHLQIIAVNDSSTDRTLELLKKYEQAYPENLFLIDLQENKGVSYSRNIALEYAQADYILCIDSDDWIEPDMIERMWMIAQNNIDYVMTIWDRKHASDTRRNPRTHEDVFFEFSTLQQRKELLMHLSKSCMPWARLIKKELLILTRLIAT